MTQHIHTDIYAYTHKHIHVYIHEYSHVHTKAYVYLCELFPEDYDHFRRTSPVSCFDYFLILSLRIFKDADVVAD